MKDNFQDSLIERLAEIEHERWSDWQAWCHKILRENCPSPGLEAVLERWDRQIATTYKDLSEQEKQSDRDQVNRYLPLLKDYIEAEIIGEDETNGQIQTRTIRLDYEWIGTPSTPKDKKGERE